MKIITFGNFKGGTGKSSLAGLQAIKLSQSHKVLLIDLDYHDKQALEKVGNLTKWQ